MKSSTLTSVTAIAALIAVTGILAWTQTIPREIAALTVMSIAGLGGYHIRKNGL